MTALGINLRDVALYAYGYKMAIDAALDVVWTAARRLDEEAAGGAEFAAMRLERLRDMTR